MILDRVFGLEMRSARLPVTGAGVGQDATLKRIFGPRGETTSGVEVTEETPMTLSAWYAAVRLIAWTLASIPLEIYERKINRDRELIPINPLWDLLNIRPNPAMNSMVYRELGVIYLLLWGNSYSYIEKNRAGKVVALWPMHPQGVEVEKLADGSLAYDISHLNDPPTSRTILFANEVLHIPGLGFNGLVGKSVVSFASQHVGESVAANEFAAGHFANGPDPTLYVFRPTRLHNRDAFRNKWKKVHSKAQREIAVMDEGMEIKSVPQGIPLKDLQYIEARQFHVIDASRFTGVPPHKLSSLERSTFSNIAEQNIEWKQSLNPWATRFDQEFTFKLFTSSNRKRFIIEHLLEKLLDGDPNTQNAAIATALQNGWKTRNEVRKMKNLPSIGPEGDLITVQSNLMTIDKLSKEPEPVPNQFGQQPPPPEVDSDDSDEGASEDDGGTGEGDGEDRSTLPRAWMEDAFRSMLRREAMEVIAAAKKPDGFLGRVEGFYRSLPEKSSAYLRTASDQCGCADETTRLVQEHAERSLAALVELSGTVGARDLFAVVNQEMTARVESLPALLADQLLREES